MTAGLVKRIPQLSPFNLTHLLERLYRSNRYFGFTYIAVGVSYLLHRPNRLGASLHSTRCLPLTGLCL